VWLGVEREKPAYEDSRPFRVSLSFRRPHAGILPEALRRALPEHLPPP
jgi:hypothetical protein